MKNTIKKLKIFLTAILSFALLTTSGCYTTRPTKTISKTDITKNQFHYGDLVKIGFTDNNQRVKWKIGTIKEILFDKLILKTSDGDISIPIENINQVLFLKKELSSGSKFFLVIGGVVGILLVMIIIELSQNPLPYN